MKKISIRAVTVILFFPLIASAQMQGSQYKINADSINSGGGESSSASYIANTTLGEAVNGEGTSATYKTKAGFQYMVNSYLTLTVDSDTQDLGSLLPGSPITGQTTLTVTTDAWNGYSLNASKDHKLRHTDGVTEIADVNGTVANPLLWQVPDDKGVGFTLIGGTNVDSKWGGNPNYKYAAFPDLATTFHSRTGFKSAADNTVVGYKVDVAVDQKAGAYACNVTYTAVAAL